MSLSANIHYREVAAGHPDTPVSDLWRLADDPFESVRAWVTRNPNAPHRLLVEMFDDESLPVSAHARFRLIDVIG